MYINNLLDDIRSDGLLFADYTKLFRKIVSRNLATEKKLTLRPYPGKIYLDMLRPYPGKIRKHHAYTTTSAGM